MPLFQSTPPSSPPPSTPPPNTPPINYDDPGIHGFTPPSSPPPYTPLPNTPPINYDDPSIHGFTPSSNDDSQYSQFSQGSQQEVKKEEETWAIGEMPPIPSYPKQIIDIDAEGYDPILMDNQKVEEYLKEDLEENVAILCNGKIYLTTRDTIDKQVEDAHVYECIEGDKKRKNNVIGNLPLYNIKRIGIDLLSDNAVGVEPEYIYMDGIDELLMSKNFWQYYSIIPLLDKQLVSVISKNEASKIGSRFTGVSALHCQQGQGGMAGIIVKAYPSKLTDTIGGKKKRKTLKKIKTIKKIKTMKKIKTIKKRKMVTLKKKNNKTRKSGTKKNV